ncbi:GntR family transcriptional regulator [Inquilinus sp. NPDC058860]|uniref:GntR family transcriptional regulator n=1 Tax=Inquilinus sp. NPDC058860 TaxID=3346652 RepID=UPI0036D122CF
MADAAATKAEFQIVPLARDTLQERVYRQVSDLILDGEIAPGQLVTIQSLAEAFGVSTMPVREALKRLTAAGALTLVTGRSMGIPKLSLDRLADLKNVRVEIEGLAAEWAARSIGDSDLGRLGEECARMDAAVRTGDVKSYLRGNRAFHFIIYRATHSPALIGVIEALWLQISPYFNLLHGSGNYISANQHHRTLLQALENRDGEAARAAMAADIDGAYDVLYRMLT